MRKSLDDHVDTFLNDLKTIDSSGFEILMQTRKIIFDSFPKVAEKIMYGGIIFYIDSDMFCGLFSYKNHISLEFSKGFLLKDPENQLEGKGKYRRHLKLKEKQDIVKKRVAYFVSQLD